jgi:glycosyltransferase involved in cell wall biosynthesis
MKRAALYLCYYNIMEPLVQTQVVAYLRELARCGFEIHLLTFEKERLDPSERSRIREELKRERIEWYALPYHGWPSLPATLYDIVRGAAKALSVSVRHEIPLVHGRSHVGAAMGLPVKWLRGAKLLFDVRGLLGDEQADVGRWTRNGFKYRLTKLMERVLFRKADMLVVLTKTIKIDLVQGEPSLRHRVDDIEIIPCCVDTRKFERDASRRLACRRALGWDGKRVLVYVGKLGTWYLAEEMVRFFAAARLEDETFFLQVLTQSNPSPMKRALEVAGVPTEAYEIGFVPPRDVPSRLEAADAGISFIRAGYSKRASCPTKVSEYLAAGLPVVSTTGIGDCDEILGRPNLGVAIERLDEREYRRAARALIKLLDDPATPGACRHFANRNLSLDAIGGPRYAAVYGRLLKPGAGSLVEPSQSSTSRRN